MLQYSQSALSSAGLNDQRAPCYTNGNSVALKALHRQLSCSTVRVMMMMTPNQTAWPALCFINVYYCTPQSSANSSNLGIGQGLFIPSQTSGSLAQLSLHWINDEFDISYNVIAR